MATLTIRDALNQALREEIIRDENVFIMATAISKASSSFFKLL